MEKSNIVLCGTHCTGKSTTIQILNQRFPEVKIVKSVTRDLKEKGFPINNTEASNYNLIQIICGNRDFENLLFNRGCMFDRTLLDTLVYSNYLYLQDKLDKWVVDMQIQLFEQVKNKFSKYFWLQPDFPLVGDGVRSEDINFRQEIHHNFEYWISYFKLPYLRIEGPQEARVELLSRYITKSQIEGTL